MPEKIKKYSKIALVIALSITMAVLYVGTPEVYAGTLTEREVRLTDSRIGQTGVDYDFLATSTSGNISCIKVWFCNAAANPSYDGTGCTAPTGIDFGNVDKGGSDDWFNLTYGNWSIIASSTKSVTASTTAAEALSSGNGGSWIFGNITNPTATGTFYLWIYTFDDTTVDCLNPDVGDVLDSGVVTAAVLGGVTVTATVVESLSVTVNASSCVDFLTGGGTSVTSTTTTIPFSEVTTEDFYDSCQRLDIGTNASNGFIARVHKTQPLTSGGSIVIPDGNCEGGCGTSTEAVWDTDTYNGFGYCMLDKDSNLAATADNGWVANGCGVSAENQYFKTISNTTTSAEAIMQSNTATSTYSSWIGYRLSVDAAQAAGTYSTVVIYTVTPKY